MPEFPMRNARVEIDDPGSFTHTVEVPASSLAVGVNSNLAVGREVAEAWARMQDNVRLTFVEFARMSRHPVEDWPWGFKICYEPLRVEYCHPDEPFDPPESMLRP